MTTPTTVFADSALVSLISWRDHGNVISITSRLLLPFIEEVLKLQPSSQLLLNHAHLLFPPLIC